MPEQRAKKVTNTPSVEIINHTLLTAEKILINIKTMNVSLSALFFTNTKLKLYVFDLIPYQTDKKLQFICTIMNI